MTGWIDGVYSKYHCQQFKGWVHDPRERHPRELKCLKPATLRKFRDDNVAMCDECFALIQSTEEKK